MNLVAVKNLEGFSKFVEEIFGASVSVRNKGENILITMSSGMLIGTKNGLFYKLTGEQELLKNVMGMWTQAMNAVQPSASTCTKPNEDE